MSSVAWFIIGVVLLVSELVFPTGFFLFLLGVAATLVGFFGLTGLVASWEIQTVIFGVLAILLPLVFVGRLRTKFLGNSKNAGGDTTGQIVTVANAIQPGEIGTGELWGSPWRIKNVDTVILMPKSEVIVVNAEGVTLDVRRKN